MKQPPAFAPHSNTQTTLSSPSPDELTRIFNTALVASKIDSVRDYSAELTAVLDTPGFRAILSAIRTLSVTEGLSERKSAETLIQTFRRVDRIWGDYVLQEGIDRLKGAGTSTGH